MYAEYCTVRVLPDTAAGPSPSISTLRSVVFAVSGSGNSTFGAVSKSPVAVIFSELEPAAVAVQSAPDASVLAGVELQATSESSTPEIAIDDRSFKDTGLLSREECGSDESAAPTLVEPLQIAPTRVPADHPIEITIGS